MLIERVSGSAALGAVWPCGPVCIRNRCGSNDAISKLVSPQAPSPRVEVSVKSRQAAQLAGAAGPPAPELCERRGAAAVSCFYSLGCFPWGLRKFV